MSEHGVGEADVAFTVLKVDRVNLVWHGGRTDLPRHGLLLKVPEADVHPHVPVEVHQDVVKAGHAVEELYRAREVNLYE